MPAIESKLDRDPGSIPLLYPELPLPYLEDQEDCERKEDRCHSFHQYPPLFCRQLLPNANRIRLSGSPGGVCIDLLSRLSFRRDSQVCGELHHQIQSPPCPLCHNRHQRAEGVSPGGGSKRCSCDTQRRGHQSPPTASHVRGQELSG